MKFQTIKGAKTITIALQLNLKPEIVIRILKSIKNWHLTVNAWQDLFNQICLHMNVLN